MTTPAETAYQNASDETGRVQELVLEHLALVNHIVERHVAGTSPETSRDDLFAAGTLGLVEAAHRYDESRGVKFTTYAYPRIRGAVVDYLRQTDWLGKSARDRLNDLEELMGAFRHEHGRKPTVPELAEAADMAEEEVLKYLSYRQWDSVGSLDRSSPDADEGTSLRDILPSQMATPLEKLEQEERIERLAGAIEDLPERERQIIVMYYYEDLYMAEMADILGISESRVSQLHTRALYNLTRLLEGEP
jgi:RNA polymerase sigma factor for flagellar operon FliA